MGKRILVRADDLGYSEGVNYGIAKSVKEGIIRCVGVMPNMPAVQHGLDLLKGIPVCYGQHTNICIGPPVTDPVLIPSLCQENGEFKSSRTYREAAKNGEDFVVLEEAVLEVEAQYQRYLELIGEQPHYFEAHAVTSANFSKALRIVSEKHDLPYLGLSFDEPVVFRNTKLYFWMESALPDYDPFVSLQKAVQTGYHEDECAMLICHPGYLDAFILKNSSLTTPRVFEVEMACSEMTHRWLQDHNVRLVTYDDL